MITESMIPEIKSVVEDYDNPLFQTYLQQELKCHHTCPVCGSNCFDYTDMYNHICDKHEDVYSTPLIQNALDPTYKLKEMFRKKQNPELLTIGEFFGKKITGDNNQMVLCSVYGAMGMGKSNATMYIGTQVSEYVSKVKGGDPKEYFNISHVGIMKLDSLIPILENIDQRKHQIIILDDLGASYSAREFNSVINKNLNKIFSTMRDTNCLVLLSTVSKFMIDKLVRRISHFQIEMVEARHNEGVCIGKLFQIVDQNRDGGKQFYHYVVSNGVKYTRCVFPRAPEWIVNDYEVKRTEIRKQLKTESIQNIRDSQSQLDGIDKEEKLPRHLEISEEVKKRIIANPKISNVKLSQEMSCSRDTIVKARQHLIECGFIKK
jgi:hypothetical protein